MLSYLAPVCPLTGEEASDFLHILSPHPVFYLKLSGFLTESPCPRNLVSIPGSIGLCLCINWVSSPFQKEQPYKLSPAAMVIRGSISDSESPFPVSTINLHFGPSSVFEHFLLALKGSPSLQAPLPVRKTAFPAAGLGRAPW